MLWSNRKIRGERQLTCCHSTALWCNKDKICIHFIYFLHESKFTSIFSEYFSSCEIKGGFRLPKFGNMGLLMKTNIKCQFGWWIHMNFCVKLQTAIFVFIEVKFATERILFCGEEAKQKTIYEKREVCNFR